MLFKSSGLKFLISFLVVIITLFAVFYSIKFSKKNKREEVSSNENPSVVSETRNFERVFSSEKNVYWRLKSERAISYSNNVFEFNRFTIYLEVRNRKYEVGGDWAVLEIVDGKLNKLAADGNVSVKLLDENWILSSKTCLLKENMVLECENTLLQTRNWATYGNYSYFDFDRKTVKLNDEVKTTAFYEG
ncbi:MAG: hypothetical protein NZT61_06290 [Deltaproteobacteria bacterium]|nr:hypothetical protein [Deltaproteobacteria bacterium]MCX7953340.1 hypothetical protein [Deltaproteobacteria bacterium]